MNDHETPRFPEIDLAADRRGGLWRPLAVQQHREILRLAWPTILAMWSHSLMWLVDTALLGHYASVDLAASGLGGLIAWTAYSLFNNLSRINGTFVSQAHGRGDHAAIGDYTWQGLYVAVFGGLILQVAGFYSHHVLALTRNPAEVIDHAYVYIKWRTASAVFTQVSFCLMGFFQGRRQVMVPMWSGLIGNAVNVILDLWLIYGWQGVALGGVTWLAMPAMGVKGAAIATSIGTALSMLFLVAWLLGPRLHRRLYRIHRPRRLDWRQLARIVRVGSPAAWENFVDMSGFTLFSVIVGTLGTAALAANQITIHLLSFVFMPMWGLTTAGAVLTGNWIGAGQPDQAAAYARQVYKLGLYYMAALGGLFLAMRYTLFAVFTDDPAVLALGPALVVVAAFFQLPDGLRMLSVGVLQGAGDTRYPMVVSLVALWLLFVPLTWLLVIHAGAAPAQAWLGGAGSYSLAALLLFLRFRSGRWQEARIFGAASARS
ncbi:MAG: MATE family efflux transporter [Candidatus Krumholzibacteria bacterium]|nr:MATE family efflux transporter [Candidatus Krumholzibacteria bacterium]